MPTSKKPRKKYNPHKPRRAALVRPIIYALPKEAMTNLQLPPHATLDAFRRGAGDQPGWHTLASAVNIGAVLSRSRPKWVQSVMEHALDAIVEVKTRGDATGQWGVSGDQLRAIGEALTLSNEIQDVCTRREIRDAINVTLSEAAI